MITSKSLLSTNKGCTGFRAFCLSGTFLHFYNTPYVEVLARMGGVNLT